MDIEKICINNLGKEVDYSGFKGMVVGCDIVFGFLILSLVEACGWNDIEPTDVILLHSPLNCSYILINPKYYAEQLVL